MALVHQFHLQRSRAGGQECVLTGLQPDRSYQIVVYGVHSPAAAVDDPRAHVFTGAGSRGSRRITKFSNEVFVMPVTDTAALVSWARFGGGGWGYVCLKTLRIPDETIVDESDST